MELLFLFYILYLISDSCYAAKSSSASSDTLSSSLVDLLKTSVTHLNIDPRTNYILPDIMFKSLARRSSGRDVNIAESTGFLGSGKYGGVYMGQSRKDNTFVTIYLLIPIYF